jgi:hypothetical protein
MNVTVYCATGAHEKCRGRTDADLYHAAAPCDCDCHEKGR